MNKVKKYKLCKSYVVLVLSIMFFVSISSIKIININAQNIEDKILCKATIDDNFDDSCVNVILQPYYSKFNIIDDDVFNKLSLCNNVLSIENTLNFPEEIIGVDGTLNYDVKSELVDHFSQIEYKQIIKVNLINKSKQNVLELIKEIELFEEVFAAEPNYYSTPADVPSDTRISEQWNLIGTNGINMPDVWDFVTGSEDVIVGVIDTGIASHNDLNDNVLTGRDFYNDNTITTDDVSNHGTCVAGIIGAEGNNYSGVSGINQKISIVPLQVSYEKEGEIKINSNSVVKAIEYVIEEWKKGNKISILNYSVSGFGISETIASAINEFDGLFVWSAGNTGANVDLYENISSFNLSNLISVGAHDKYNERSIWGDKSSCYGSKVDIFAPGGKGELQDDENCLTTSADSTNPYRYFSGTSCAAPHVSGVAALLLSINPNLTPSQLKNVILNSADTISITIPGGSRQNVKKLNAFSAAKNVLNGVSSPETMSGLDKTLNKVVDSTSTFFNENSYFIKLNIQKECTYDFTVSSTSMIGVVLYDSNFDEISISITSYDSLKTREFVENLSIGIYYLKVYYLRSTVSGTINVSIVYNHSYSMQYYNYMYHKEICDCGQTTNVTEAHSILQSQIINNRYAQCLGCHHLLDLNSDVAFIQGINGASIKKVSINGSYILPSGIIVLVDEDLDAYLNGTLVFYDKDSIPVME